MKIRTAILLFSFITTLLCSCREKKFIDVQREIIQLDSLEYYNPNSVSQNSSDYYVVTYVNTACPTCVSEIEKWNEIYKKLKEKSCGLRIVCYADDYFAYFKYQISKGNVRSDVGFYLDTTSRFSKRNVALFRGKADKSGLIDRQNMLLSVGNPIHEKGVLEKYMELIN